MMDKLHLLVPLSWRNLWRNPRRTILTIAVVAAGLWSVLIFATLLSAWSRSCRDTTLKLIVGQAEIHAAGYLDDPTAAHSFALPAGLQGLLRSPVVAAYSKRVRLSAIVQSEYKTLPITLVGVNPEAERKLSVLPQQVLRGRYLSGPNDRGIFLGRDLLRRLKSRVGKRVVLLLQNKEGAKVEAAFAVIGEFSAPEGVEAEFGFSGIRTVQVMAKLDGRISEVAFNVNDDASLSPLLTSMRKRAPTLDIQSWASLTPLAYAISVFFDEFAIMWLWLMFVLMAIGIVNTQLMAVLERRREFGLLQAIGMRAQLVLFEVAIESTILIGLGVGVGVLLSVASVAAFHNGLDLGFLGPGAELVGAGRVLYPTVDPLKFAIYSLVIWVLSVAATLWPARRASHVRPVEAMARTAA